jgi:biopolymer transport protein ExbD
VVEIRRGQMLYLNGKAVNINDLVPQLAKRFKDQKSVYIAADSSIRWDLLAQVLAELGGAHIAAKMVTKPIESRGQ